MGNHHWTIHAIYIIKKSFHEMHDRATARLLSGRTPCAVACKRRALNLKYTQEWMNEKLKLDRNSPYAFC